jgi:glycosyltransferase involved in cell wall biosynthesis
LKSVTIVCFTFPPFDGIGGRRWAKFAKYLNRAGADVHVIAANKSIANNESNWLKDTVFFKDRISYLPMNYPFLLTTIPSGIIQKIKYRLAWYFVKLIVKGNYFDHSSFFSRNLLLELEKKIQGGTKNIIVSCAPFHMAFEVIKLKEKYSEVSFIVDFRDPWTNNKTSFGFTGLSKKRLEYEKFKERKVIEAYDKVISVSEEMTNYFKSILSTNTQKCITIPNGFDIEDIDIIDFKKSKNNICRFIFTGTLYNKSMHMFELFCKAISELEIEFPEIKGKIQIDFYGDVPNDFERQTKILNFVNFHGSVSTTQVYEEIQKSDLALLFLTDDLNYSFSTKFYEYIAMKTSIVVVSKEGFTGKYIENNNLGYSINEWNAKDKIKEIYNNWQDNTIINNPDYHYQNHEISYIVNNQLKDLII